MYEELGKYRSNGMGLQPLDWKELQSYQQVTGNTLSCLEAILIMDMSKAFVSMYNQSNDTVFMLQIDKY
mgnify:FL=1|jgi:hypothetical protein